MTAQVKWQVNKSHIVDLPPPRSPVGGIHEALGIPGSPDPKNVIHVIILVVTGTGRRVDPRCVYLYIHIYLNTYTYYIVHRCIQFFTVSR